MIDANLHDTTDARVWADEFCKNWPTALSQIPGREGVEAEEDFNDIMVGWFANAIMAGVDSVSAPSPAAVTVKPINHVRARGGTLNAMRSILSATIEGKALINAGDTVLVWVNEGDLFSFTPAPVAEAAVTVKPLEFEEYNLTGEKVDGFQLLKRSLNRSYNYWLDRRLSDGFFMVRFDQSMSHQTGGKTEEEAISNASKEHERRILSALTPAPVAGWRDMESAPKEDHESDANQLE